MRLSTSMMYQQNMQGIINGQATWQKTGEQLSTGKRVVNPSDDPIAAASAIMLGQAQSENSQYTLARTFAKQSMSLEESILNKSSTTITSALTEVIKGGGVLNDDDRKSVATSLRGMKAELLNMANSTDGNGNYIFSGYETDNPPFVDGATGIQYVGGNQAISQRVDSARNMTVGHTGSAVFNGVTGDAKKEPDGSIQSDLFETLDIAIKALETPLADADDATKANVAAALETANRGLNNSLNNISSVRAELGIQLNEIDNLDAVGKDRDVANKTTLSQLQDTDWYEAISSYIMQQSSLQASYTAFQNMQGMSLFQMK
ncbi:flagellar hook-associated protein FlgL [Pectobacterium aroidearum]|jgi:flagellar hook-associated protein 3 FlgL|uniref:Flagellar hook-associated protein FlgL n=1 Tax=Pectobacterium aroidearum TaxID=1201031 RepID=A0AAW3SR15_9GAMM|nr:MULTISPECIES: flagellar hook-associated protein FlgL [Pectobacterium]MBA0204461.1 flagellar hook-associated protein FlgL [Pectobacterium aroidearum]MBA5198820.1 flagellar hook-associated protein FlgL [Pectobacterium aroidearum]MBA5203133.1 flagellar hook-associated protein FlgL [Pectobacterium aroidearum]MBA5226677.1 flagellar hook-associated protein FlgL [Pectobacterium aroidearum]MBA5231612.1 flagellar hook-associated protein FlgL [Pectobacterium aroidearum]